MGDQNTEQNTSGDLFLTANNMNLGRDWTHAH